MRRPPPQFDASHEPLAGPFATTPSRDGALPSAAVQELAHTQVKALLQSNPNFWAMDDKTRHQMEDNLAKIAAYSAALVQEDWALSKQLGQKPMLRTRTSAPLAAAQAAPGQNQKAPPPPPAEEFSPRAAKNVAQITRDTLNAIAFPTFVADLIKGTYFAIIGANYAQIEQFSSLLANVAKTVDEFMADNISENQARDYLVQSYPSVFSLDASGDSPKVTVRDDAPDSKPDFKSLFNLQQDVDVDDDSAEETLVPGARRKLAKNRHQMLAAMVLMGINRIVVTSGHINAKMGFRINTKDIGHAATASEFDEHNEVSTGFGGGLGALFGGPEASFQNSVTYVSSTKKDSSDELDVQADLTGEVDLKFKSDYFPVSRFADPNMLALIQGNTPNPAANQPVSPGSMQKTDSTTAAPAAAASQKGQTS
jgi:hypothetical protein